jgi:hypothetical protein
VSLVKEKNPDIANVSKVVEHPRNGKYLKENCQIVYGEYSARHSTHREQSTGQGDKTADSRSRSVLDLKTKVNEATYLNKSERERLFNLLVPYLDHFTDKPGNVS